MFFPEKIEEDQRLNLLSKIAKGKETGLLEVTAIKLCQKGVDMYVAKMRVGDILDLYELDSFKEDELEGYQRERYEERMAQIVEYIEKSPLAIMPAILVGLRETKFEVSNKDIGILKINRKKGVLWIIDGQHRIGAFSKIREQFIFTKKIDVALFTKLMDYEFPVVFVDSSAAAEKICSNTVSAYAKLSPQDIERTIFFIVNKTQRGISPSLKDALLYSIKTSGIDGLSIIDKEGWRIFGAQIAISLNCKDNSPLKAKINVSGQRDSGKPIQLNTFVSSLEPLFKDKDFQHCSIDEKIDFLTAYWSAIRDLVPQAFDSKELRQEAGEEFGRRFALNINDKRRKNQKSKRSERYLLLTALSIHTLHRIARDLLHSTLKSNIPNRTEFLKESLAPLKSFDWRTESSPLSALGGMKGVSKAYELLSEILKQDTYSIG